MKTLNVHWKYLVYILRHKWFVLVASIKIGAPVWRAIAHDFSKFLPSEWFAYARYFYGDTNSENLRLIAEYGLPELIPYGIAPEDRFDMAWLLHQHRNPHHWQFWVLREDSGTTKLQPMPRSFVLEMVADWMGAGRAITGKWEALDWYLKNRDKIQLREETHLMVESILKDAAK